MGTIIPRPTMRARESRGVQERLRIHAQFMRQLEGEGWDRSAASSEALRMLEKIDKKDRSSEPS